MLLAIMNNMKRFKCVKKNKSIKKESILSEKLDNTNIHLNVLNLI